MLKRVVPHVAALLLILTSTACADDALESRGSAVVTFDAFSGVPNPTWPLAEDQATELLSMFHDLARTDPAEYPGDLGYRGVIVTFADGSQIWLSRGIAVEESTGIARVDSERALEVWVLETGRGTVDETLLDSTIAEVAG